MSAATTMPATTTMAAHARSSPSGFAIDPMAATVDSAKRAAMIAACMVDTAGVLSRRPLDAAVLSARTLSAGPLDAAMLTTRTLDAAVLPANRSRQVLAAELTARISAWDVPVELRPCRGIAITHASAMLR
jgi:hypothetical protein